MTYFDNPAYDMYNIQIINLEDYENIEKQKDHFDARYVPFTKYLFANK